MLAWTTLIIFVKDVVGGNIDYEGICISETYQKHKTF